nr:hypothetical protein Q903MT_gene5376 [Picea sitchensis]
MGMGWLDGLDWVAYKDQNSRTDARQKHEVSDGGSAHEERDGLSQSFPGSAIRKIVHMGTLTL